VSGRFGDLDGVAWSRPAVAPDDRVFKPDAHVDSGSQAGIDDRPVGAGVTVPEARALEHRDAGIDGSGELDCGSVVVLDNLILATAS